MATKTAAPVAKKVSGGKVTNCGCQNDYQDRKYGNNRRFHNATNKGFRCTSCGQDKTESTK